MNCNNKLQEGVFIGVFALATLVVISLAVSFMSNRVNDMLKNQGQMIAGKQSYWLGYSGMEINSTNRFAGITAGTNTYALEGGTITTVGTTSADKFNGSNRTNVITSTGTDADGSRQLKWTLGNPTNYALILDGTDDYIDVGNVHNAIQTISFWIYASDITSHTDYVIDLNGTDYIKIVDGEVTENNIESPTFYVNSVLSEQTIAAINTWYHVVITTGTAIDANDVDIGRLEGVGGAFLNGIIDQVTIWNTELSLADVRSLYAQGRAFSAASIQSANAQGSWYFENNVNDSSGNGKNGTAQPVLSGPTFTGS